MKKNRDSVPPIQQTNSKKKNRDSVPPIQQAGQPIMPGGPFGMGGGPVGVGAGPIDFVRSNAYDAAMAEQAYNAILADMMIRARENQFMGLPPVPPGTQQLPPPAMQQPQLPPSGLPLPPLPPSAMQANTASAAIQPPVSRQKNRVVPPVQMPIPTNQNQMDIYNQLMQQQSANFAAQNVPVPMPSNAAQNFANIATGMQASIQPNVPVPVTQSQPTVPPPTPQRRSNIFGQGQSINAF
jgi:hypothetical protein